MGKVLRIIAAFLTVFVITYISILGLGLTHTDDHGAYIYLGDQKVYLIKKLYND